MNNLKFFKFKQRLLFKSLVKGCKVYLVNEAHTTKTCSSCGTSYDIQGSKTYNCSGCNNVFDRDVNSGKNILMKGIITNM